MGFTFLQLAIPDVIVIRTRRHRDLRGSFSEIYRRTAFAAAGIDVTFVQDNLTSSTRGALRGLHYQLPPAAQGKLIRVVQGRVFDVAVDLRRGGPTYGQWVGRELDGASDEMLWVPAGFAHGYCVLSDTADLLYKVTADYAPDLARGLRWDDPSVAVDWPVTEPILSEADRFQPSLAECENPFESFAGPPRE